MNLKLKINAWIFAAVLGSIALVGCQNGEQTADIKNPEATAGTTGAGAAGTETPAETTGSTPAPDASKPDAAKPDASKPDASKPDPGVPKPGEKVETPVKTSVNGKPVDPKTAAKEAEAAKNSQAAKNAKLTPVERLAAAVDSSKTQGDFVGKWVFAPDAATKKGMDKLEKTKGKAMGIDTTLVLSKDGNFTLDETAFGKKYTLGGTWKVQNGLATLTISKRSGEMAKTVYHRGLAIGFAKGSANLKRSDNLEYKKG